MTANDGPRLLFVPVSGPRGMGEYARALTIAHGAARRWPQAGMHFVVSREAPYATELPFPATLLPSSPTFHTQRVVELIGSWRPSVVIFDNAGRSAQVRAARQNGARIVFVSSRTRQRRRAFRLAWMRCLDEHWIAYPAILAGAPTRIERWKLRWLGRPTLRYLAALLPAADPDLAQTVRERFGVRDRDYVLVAPGGGSGHPGAEHAPETFHAAARRIAASGVRTLLVGAAGDMDASPSGDAGSLCITPRLPVAALAELLRGARLVVCNGGSTLLQALACGRPCVAAAVAHDQRQRLALCAEAGLVVAARLEVDDIVARTLALLDDEARCGLLVGRAADAGIANGLDTALDAIAGLLEAGRNTTRG